MTRTLGIRNSRTPKGHGSNDEEWEILDIVECDDAASDLLEVRGQEALSVSFQCQAIDHWKWIWTPLPFASEAASRRGLK
jgi:hypothetical protein